MRTLWAGIGLQFLGIAGEAYWHAELGGSDAIVPIPHWVAVIGMVVTLYAAYNSWQAADGGRFGQSMLAVVIGSASELVGFTWIHVQRVPGVELPFIPLPVLVPIGLLLVLGGSIAAFVLARRGAS